MYQVTQGSKDKQTPPSRGFNEVQGWESEDHVDGIGQPKKHKKKHKNMGIPRGVGGELSFKHLVRHMLMFVVEACHYILFLYCL